MKNFEYFKVASASQALSLLTRYSDQAAILAGGSDLLGIMKDRLEGPKFRMPQYLIDIKGIRDLGYIREHNGGLKIGATTTIAEMAASRVIAEKFPLLSQAARHVAVPQIRNVATLGGNLCQRPRCSYFRRSLFNDCYRKGGDTCYAVAGENQYNAVVGGYACYMAYPSDLAPALTALNARVEIAAPKANRVVPIEQFYVGPQKNILRENILTPQEMVVAVEIPQSEGLSKGAYLKLKERQAFDFAIVSVAVNLTMKSSLVTDARIVFGAIAPYPIRSRNAELALRGKTVNAAIGACCEAALDRAKPLSHNRYKVTAAKGVLEQALASLS